MANAQSAMAASMSMGIAPASGHYRWVICALLFFATTINYIDRQVLGILAAPLQKELGWSESQYGLIATAFTGAYAIGLVLVGRLMDWLGTRKGLGLAVIAWSVAAAGHALASLAFGFGLASDFDADRISVAVDGQLTCRSFSSQRQLIFSRCS